MESDKNRKILMGLAAIVVILLIVVVYMFIQRNSTTSPAQSANEGAASNATTGSGTAADIQEVAFDPATATKVPAGETPEVYLERYLTACDQKDWQTAFEMLPLDRKNYYKTAEAFGGQLEAYGINGHSVEKVSDSTDEDGNPLQVLKGTMKTPNGNFAYDWTFVEVSGQWYAKTRGTVEMQ